MTRAEKIAEAARRIASGAPAPTSSRAAPCARLGAATGKSVTCPSCSGSVQLKKFACSEFGACTLERAAPGTACCKGCKSYQAAPKIYPEVTTRHLLYHVYPRRDSRWRTRILRLRERIELFNGRRVIAVATDDTTDTPRHVERELGGCGCEILPVPNDPSRREVASFLPLFETIAGHAGPGDATLWAHAKGATRGNHRTVHRWVEVLESIMLGNWPSVEKVLKSHPTAGCFKKVGRGWPAHESASAWHYSGSWFWFRNAALFKKPDWRRIDQFWGGIEPYPSLHFSVEDAGCVFHEAPVQAMNLYNQLFYWDNIIEPALRARPDLSTRLAAVPQNQLRVEIGGGDNPLGNGWVNVDRCDSADRRLDLEKDPLPFDDATVDAVYSSHCFEHVVNLKHLLREVVRVCRVGAAVEIRVPHWLSDMAMCHDHKQTIPEEQVEHWCESAVGYWFGDGPRKLAHVRTERVPSKHFAEARALLPHMTDEQVMRFVPNTVHECRYFFTVAAR